MNRNFQISKETLDKVKLAKKYIENRYQTLVEEEIRNKQHWARIMDSINSTTQTFDQITQHIIQKQSINKRLQRQKDKLENYRLFNIIGRGAFGEVRLAQKIATNQIVAIKRLQKRRLLQKKQIYNAYLERDFMVNSKSSHIVQLKSAFQDQHYLFIAMQYVPGGDLLHLLIEKDILSQDQTRFYIAEMILAVEQIHKLNYLHRDIKPDNILLDENGHVKISDFGLSKYLEKKDSKQSKIHLSKMQKVKKFNRLKTREKIFSKVGTPDYISPEVLTDHVYDHSVDIWGIGVIMFQCLFGYPPFTDDDSKEVCYRVINWLNFLEFPSDIQVSTAAKMLILGMINDKNKRLTIQQIKQHPFFVKINWETLHTRKAPNIPKLKSPFDVSNFDKFQVQNPWISSQRDRPEFEQRIDSNFKFPGFEYRPILEDPFVQTIKNLQRVESMKSLSKSKSKKKMSKRLKTQQCERLSHRKIQKFQKMRYSIKSQDKDKQDDLKKLPKNIKFRCSVKESNNRSIDKQNVNQCSNAINIYKLKPFKKMTKVKVDKVKQAYGTKMKQPK